MILLALLITIGVIGLLLLIFYPHGIPFRLIHFLPYIACCLSVWSLVTGWFWWYYLNLYISLPPWLAALIITIFCYRRSVNLRLVRLNVILLACALLLSTASFIQFMI